MQPDPEHHVESPSANVLLDELKAIREELQSIREHPFLHRYQSKSKLILFGFLKGMLTGFATVIGATIIVSLFIYFLSQVEFIPIVGEWLKQIIEEIELSRRYNPR